jgi:O-antigen/teichoic acid export membrane protein
VTSAPDPSTVEAGTALRGGAQIAVAVGVMNVATYGFTMLAARLLGPEAYGGFAAVMNLLIVVSVAALALQATAARRIASDRTHVAQIEHTVLRTSWLAGLAIGSVLLVLSPVVDRLLRLDDLRIAWLVAFSAVFLTVMGGQAGVLQGERRWAPLAVLYVATGVPRLLVGTALLAWRPSELAAVAAVALTTVAPVVVGWWALRGGRVPGPRDDRHAGRSVLRESALNSQALLAFFALSNLDVVVARNVLDDHASGLYAAGLILTKALLFLPQFVVVLAFPDMAASRRGPALAAGVATISGLGALGVLGCWLLPDVALAFVGGAAFADVRDQLWSFALLGTVLAVLQLLVYSVLARDGRASSAWIWLALVAMLAVGSTASSAGELVNRVLAVDAALLVVLLVAARLGTRRVPR